MSGMRGALENVRIVLTCDECGATSRPRPWLRGTKQGVLRLVGGVEFGWYVDGGRVFCREHVPAELRDHPAQRETWGEHDRSSVEGDQEYERWQAREAERIGLPAPGGG